MLEVDEGWVEPVPDAAMIGWRRGAVLVGAVLVLAGCGAASTVPSTPASPTPEPSASPSAVGTLTPTPAPTSAPSLVRLSMAVVTVDELDVREAASGGAALVPDAGPLTRGDRVLVLAGPASAEGYNWYAVGIQRDPDRYAAPQPVGWVAAGTATDPWLAPDPRSCPEPGVDTISSLSPVGRLACYGPTSLALSAHQAAVAPDAGLGGTCEVPDLVPYWLACTNVNYNWINEDGGTDWLLQLHFDPATLITPTGLAPAGTTGPALVVAGHFEDPAADACVTASDPQSIDAMSQWLTCAVGFVVESVTPG